MLIKTKITKFYANDKDKSGRLFTDKNGKPYKKVAIQIDYPEYSGQYISCLVFRDDAPELALKVGDEAEILIERKGEYLNFRLPTRSDLFEARIDALEKQVKYLSSQISPVGGGGYGGKVEAEIDLSDLPAEEIPF